MEQEANDILREHRYDFCIKSMQLDVINSVIESRDTLAVLPTGYGKTVCFFLPPLIKAKRENKCYTSLVVSPLTSLIDEQVRVLRHHGINAYGIHDGIGKTDVDGIKKGEAVVLMSSPESILKKHWRKVLSEVYCDKLCMVAYDEAHCISEWGLDFREDYRKVGVLQSYIDCSVLALSATITKEIQSDIEKVLGMTDPHIVSLLPNRDNIMLHVTKSTEHFEELGWAEQEIRKCGCNMKKTIIYVNSISLCERLYMWFHSTLKERAYHNNNINISYRLIEMFHAHTDEASKARILENFARDGTIRILIATVAVGMGMDIPDISIVVIWGLPPSLLQLWQEMGRGGRDGRKCIAICYAYPRSIAVPCDKCRKKLNRKCDCPARKYMRDLPTCTSCQRVYILKHFSLLGTGHDNDLESLQTLQKCNGNCVQHSCSCDFCKCCSNCMKLCLCPKRKQTVTDLIKSYFS